MTLYKYKLEIENGIKEGLEKLKLSDMPFQVRETKNPEFGELYSNLPFVLAKKLKKNPIEIAEELAKNIKINERKDRYHRGGRCRRGCKIWYGKIRP